MKMPGIEGDKFYHCLIFSLFLGYGIAGKQYQKNWNKKILIDGRKAVFHILKVVLFTTRARQQGDCFLVIICKHSISGSQYIFRLTFMAIWCSNHVLQDLCPNSIGEDGSFRDFTQSSQFECWPKLYKCISFGPITDWRTFGLLASIGLMPSLSAPGSVSLIL